jgi:hypothetical protein
MTTVRVVQGTRVLAQIRVETVAEGTTVEVDDAATVEAPAPAPPPAPPRPRSWPAGLGWTAFGVAGLLARSLLEASFWSPWNHARWLGLALQAVLGPLVLAFGAGVLFIVLKVIGRRLRFADAVRATAFLAWLLPALTVTSQAAYYPLSPQAHSIFDGLLVAAAVSFSLAALASLRREPRSLTFTAAWAAVSLAAILGLTSVASLSDAESGKPAIDLDLQAPIAGYAGSAGNLDDYLAAIRTAAQPRPAAAP